MEIVLYLAMTAAEFRENSHRFPKIAWMACHFSPYGTGLSNLPAKLPKGSLLMVNDRTPVSGHEPERIAGQLKEVVEELQCCGIALDFQRANEPQTQRIATAVAALPFPVAVTPQYAHGLSCAVLLPPIPMTTLPEDYLFPWKGRDIWLEVEAEGRIIRVTPEGSQEMEEQDHSFPCPHLDEQLHCQYGMDIHAAHVDFHLRREKSHLEHLMQDMASRGVSHFVGLYQQLGQSFCQSKKE